MSGFTFDMGGSSSGSSLDLGSFDGRAVPYTPFTFQTNVRVDNTRITGGAFDSTSVHAFRVSLSIAGVADDNIVDGFRLPLDFNGGLSGTGPYYGGQWSWDNFQLVYGSSNQHFMFEDNVFTFGHTGEADASLTQCEFSGKYSFRYNTINSLVPGAPILDLHGNDGTGSTDAMYSCFGGELYGNQVNASGYWLNQRGGKFLSFYNNFANDSSFIPTEEHADSELPATPEPQHVHDTYYWNNRQSLTGSVIPVNVGSTINGVPAINQDFWTDANSNGVRCGTPANKPSACTIGQAYWETNQSCNDLTGLVGDIKTYPARKTISGTLYKCTASDTWTAVFQPLTYPHPLRAGSATIVKLLAPTSLRVVL